MAELIFFIVLEIFNLVMATVILTGKMDNFIRNSFELTPKDAGKFDIRRLRILMGVAFLALIPVFCLLLLNDTKGVRPQLYHLYLLLLPGRQSG